jgi:hypothetical protein
METEVEEVSECRLEEDGRLEVKSSYSRDSIDFIPFL